MSSSVFGSLSTSEGCGIPASHPQRQQSSLQRSEVSPFKSLLDDLSGGNTGISSGQRKALSELVRFLAKAGMLHGARKEADFDMRSLELVQNPQPAGAEKGNRRYAPRASIMAQQPAVTEAEAREALHFLCSDSTRALAYSIARRTISAHASKREDGKEVCEADFIYSISLLYLLRSGNPNVFPKDMLFKPSYFFGFRRDGLDQIDFPEALELSSELDRMSAAIRPHPYPHSDCPQWKTGNAAVLPDL